MGATLLLGLGMLLVVEGLVFALAPSRLEDMLRTLRDMPIEARRLVGLIAVVCGAAIIAISRMIVA